MAQGNFARDRKIIEQAIEKVLKDNNAYFDAWLETRLSAIKASTVDSSSDSKSSIRTVYGPVQVAH